MLSTSNVQLVELQTIAREVQQCCAILRRRGGFLMILRNPEFWLHNSLQEPCNFNGESLRERVGRDCQRRRRRCSPQRPSDSGLSQAVLPVGQLVPLAQRSLHARRGGTPPLTTFLATEACGAGQPSPSSVHLKRGAPTSHLPRGEDSLDLHLQCLPSPTP